MPSDGGEPVEGLRRAPSSAIPTTASPGPTSTSPPSAIEHELRRRADAHEPHAVRRLRQILPEHLRQRRGAAGRRRPCRSACGSAPTTTATTARTCSARPTSSGRTASAGIDQTLLFGFEVGRQKSRNQRNTGTLSGSRLIDGNAVPLTDPTVDVDVIWAPIASDANNRVKATVAAVYIQDQIRSRPMARDRRRRCASTASSSMSTICAPSAAASSAAATSLWSPRLGLVAQAERQPVALRQLQPVLSAAVGRPVQRPRPTSPKALKPERFDNYEVGAKWEILDGLLATAAIYQLDRTNTRATDPAAPGTYRADRRAAQPRARARPRAQRHQPLADVRRLRAAEGRDHARPPTAAPAGREVPLVPRHSFSLWNRYDFTKPLGAGPRRDRALEVLRVDQQRGEAAGLRARRRARCYYQLPRGHRSADQCREHRSARTISRPPTPTTISRPARRGRSRRRSAIGF